MPFASLDDIRAFCRDLPGGDRRFADIAAQRQQNLTKPPGSLGRLEELAIWLAQWQGREKPRLERVTIAVFAGNHGVAARGVSAYPPAVTAQMVANFAAGGAAINQIAKAAAAELRVVPIELERPTRDFTEAAAMSADEFLEAVDTGYRTVPEDCDLLAVGEMGIANTTAAATLCAALLGGGAARWAGRGTGVDDDGLARKRAAIEAALNFHRGILGDPLAVAAALGGRELAAIAGAVLAARRHHIPVLLDGFVATSAVLPLARLDRRRARSLPRRARLGRIRPPRSAAGTEAAIRCSTSTCGSARRRARGSRSCWRAPRWPATPGWRHSPRPASPARRIDETLPHISA